MLAALFGDETGEVVEVRYDEDAASEMDEFRVRFSRQSAVLFAHQLVPSGPLRIAIDR